MNSMIVSSAVLRLLSLC